MTHHDDGSDDRPVTWRELRLAISDILDFSNQFTIYAAMTNASQGERDLAEEKLRRKAAELEAKYRLDDSE